MVQRFGRYCRYIKQLLHHPCRTSPLVGEGQGEEEDGAYGIDAESQYVFEDGPLGLILFELLGYPWTNILAIYICAMISQLMKCIILDDIVVLTLNYERFQAIRL